MPRPRHQSKLLLLLVAPLLLLSTSSVGAQTNVPISSGFATEFKIWTSGGTTFVNVRLTFSDTGHSVSDWGTLTRVGNEFIANAKVYRWTGGSGQAITYQENTYVLGSLQSGQYTFSFKSHGATVKSAQFDPSQVIEGWEPTTLSADQVYFAIWQQEGLSYVRVNFVFPDDGYSVLDWGQISRVGSDFSIDTKVERRTVPSTARTHIVDRTFQLGTLAPGTYTFTLKMYGTVIKSQQFSVSAGSSRTPRLLSEANSQSAVALDSVSWLRQFPLDTDLNFSTDRRLRIMLLATDVDLPAGASSSDLTAYAEDSLHRLHAMTVEYVGTVPGFEWLTQIVVRPPDELRNVGEIGVIISVRGIASNKVFLNIQPSTPNSQ